MNIVVQKFGGTSVATNESREKCIEHIQVEINQGNKVVVVVSAMGRKGSPYATDTLLSLLDNEHKESLSKKDLDLFISTGELISASVFSNLLHSKGLKNTILTGGQCGIITNDNFNDADIISLKPQLLLSELKKYDVIVVPGFQGQTIDGYTTTLGRGGSDTTATALGVALKSKYVDIFSDVEGVMTADPRIVPNAKILNRIGYNEILNLAQLGAKVIHPRAVEMAMKENIAIRIRSTFSNELGTLISNQNHNVNESKHLISGVTQTSNLIQVSVKKKSFQNVYSYLSERNISLDFIQTTVDNILFTTPKDLKEKVIGILELNKLEYEILENVSKVSIVGSGMKGIPGVMAKAIQSLYNKQIEVYQSADSHTTIWFLVKQERMNDAVCALHNAFVQ